jgi:hypothetical protein
VPRTPGIRCPDCRYDLRGLSESTCPECGARFDLAQLSRRHERRRRRSRFLWSLAASLFSIYSPYCWLLFTDYPWSSYRWHWVRMWPVLPGLFPAHLLARKYSSPVEYVIMGLITAAVLSVAVLLGSRGLRWLVVTAALIFLLSVLNSWMAYHAFRM